MSYVARKITPSSLNSTYKGAYEYFLVWLAPNGGIRQWLFSSTDGGRKENYKSIVIDSKNSFRSVPNKKDTTILLNAKSLSKVDFDYVCSVFDSNIIHWVKPDSTHTQVAIKKGKKDLLNVVKDFSVEIEMMLQEPDLLNV